MSKYGELVEALEKLKCPQCGGLGTCNDADPGDIGFSEWVCTNCKGEGVNPDPAVCREFMHVLTSPGPAVQVKGELHGGKGR